MGVHLGKKRNTSGIEQHKWKPGQSGNPSGKEKDPLTQEKIKRLISQYSKMTFAELQSVVADPNSTWVQSTVAKHMLESQDDIAVWDKIMDRSVGKVKDTKEIILPKPTVVERMNGPQMILGAKMQEIEGEVLEGGHD